MKRAIFALSLVMLMAAPVLAQHAASPRGASFTISTGDRVYVGVVGLQSGAPYPARIVTITCDSDLTIMINPTNDALGFYDGANSVYYAYGADAGEIDHYVDRAIDIPANTKRIFEGRITEILITDGSGGGTINVYAEY